MGRIATSKDTLHQVSVFFHPSIQIKSSARFLMNCPTSQCHHMNPSTWGLRPFGQIDHATPTRTASNHSAFTVPNIPRSSSLFGPYRGVV